MDRDQIKACSIGLKKALQPGCRYVFAYLPAGAVLLAVYPKTVLIGTEQLFMQEAFRGRIKIAGGPIERVSGEWVFGLAAEKGGVTGSDLTQRLKRLVAKHPALAMTSTLKVVHADALPDASPSPSRWRRIPGSPCRDGRT